jgi:hypothetical protein
MPSDESPSCLRCGNVEELSGLFSYATPNTKASRRLQDGCFGLSVDALAAIMFARHKEGKSRFQSSNKLHCSTSFA